MNRYDKDGVWPKTVQDKPFKQETPNGIARSSAVSPYYGNRKQVDWAAGGKANRSGE